MHPAPPPTPPKKQERKKEVLRIVLATVNNDVFGSDAPLQHAHLWMVPSSSEKARRLDAEISDPLLVVVHDTETILLKEPLIFLFDFLQGA